MMMIMMTVRFQASDCPFSHCLTQDTELYPLPSVFPCMWAPQKSMPLPDLSLELCSGLSILVRKTQSSLLHILNE